MKETIKLAARVPLELDGERLDQVAARLFPEYSRSRLQTWIKTGELLVDGEQRRPRDKVNEGDALAVDAQLVLEVGWQAQEIDLDLVYEDESILVLNKPAGLVVHPAAGHADGTLVNALLARVPELAQLPRAGIVHRLDMDTSGLMVVAKGDEAHIALSNAIRRREVRRIYRAVAWGHLPESPMTVDAPVGRDPRERKRMAVVEGGRQALTRIRVRERWTAAEYLDVSLKTGRTHQIRVHLAHLGHPVVGDTLYGPKWARGMSGTIRAWAQEMERRAPRQLLHSSDLSFLHPISGEEMKFHVRPPPDMASIVRWAKGEEGEKPFPGGDGPAEGAHTTILDE